MNNAFEELWSSRMSRLPKPQPLILLPVPNVGMEYLSCILCGHGHEEAAQPPEWLVTHRTSDATVTRGLHEACRRRNGVKLPAINAAEHPGPSLAHAAGITACEYEARWGQHPSPGDLIQVNCIQHGAAGHTQCGVCADCGKPRHLPRHENCKDD